jgi:hypothetical protein
MRVVKWDIRVSKPDSLRSGINLELKSSFGPGALSNLLRSGEGVTLERLFTAYKRVVADIAIFSVRRCPQWAEARRRNASIAVNIAEDGGRARIGFLCTMPLG